MKAKHFFLHIITALLFCIEATAQTIGGRIADTQGKPIVGATVVELNTLTGSASDDNGRFSFRYDGQFPTHIAVRSVGFVSDTLAVAHSTSDLRITLRTAEVQGQEVNVFAQKKETNFERIDASIASSVPSVDGGIEGVIKSQIGVSSNSELSSQYRVRGGNFDENLVYVNGIEIYRPFLIRSGEQEGLSFVNPDMVSELNFSAGGFDASYGDKMSSVLDVKYKVPREMHWGVKASLLGASAHAEGSTKNGFLTHLSGVRYKTNQYLFGSLDTKGDYEPTFFDAQTYWTLHPSDRTQIGVLAYFAINNYRFKPSNRETSFGTISDAKTLTIYFEGKERDKYRTLVTAIDAKHSFSDDLTVSVTASMYRADEEEYYDILGEYWLQQALNSQSTTSVDQSENIGVGGYLQHARNNLFSEVYSASAKGSLRLPIGLAELQIKMTREHYNDYTDEWELTDSAGYITSPSAGALIMDEVRNAHSNLWQTKSEAYIINHGKPIALGNGTFQTTLGFRVANLNTDDATIFSPRLSFSYAIKKWRLRLATGRYDQLPNLREMKRTDATLNRDVKPQKSWQLIGGADLYFGSAEHPFKFTTEVYYKWLRDINPYSIDNVRIRYEAENSAKGYAAGVDFKLNGELIKDAESWITLSFMKTMEDIENDGHGYIPRPSDQRFQLSMMLQDYMPNNKSATAMLSMFFGSGLPFGPSGSERWQQTNRMSGYKRVDLGFYKDFAVDREGVQKREHLRTAKIGVEIFNLFDTENTISYLWVSDNDGHRYGVPNYLTSRRINAKLTIEF